MSKFSMILGVTFILTIYGCANFYIGKKFFQWIRLMFPYTNGIAFAVIYCFFALSLFMMFLPLPSMIKGILGWIGSYWMGILIYLFLFFLVADLITLFGSLLKIIPAPVPQGIMFYSGLAAIL